MSNNIQKIIYRKNDDGTLTKVLVRKVKKNIKVKPFKKDGRDSPAKKPSSTSGTQSAHQKTAPPKGAPEKDSPRPAFGFSTIDGRTTAKSPFLRQGPRASENKQKTKPAGARSSTAPTSTPSSPSSSPPIYGKEAPGQKIVITKRRSDQKGGSKGNPFYQKGANKSFLEERKNRNYAKNFTRFDEDLQKKEKSAVDELAGVPKEIEIQEVISIKDLALKLNLKASQVIKKVFNLGVVDLTVNDTIDSESAELVASEFGCKVKVVTVKDQTTIELEKGEEKDYVPRAPIVTVMGHVDHGKTSLLDKVRKSEVAEGEQGGITQHIGATKVRWSENEIVFIDTPGHEAFSNMRARGAKITDIVVIVVSATEGVLPQTIESITHAKASKCPIIVAVTKIDLADADFEKVRNTLSSHDVISEKWGGDVPFYAVSSVTGEGIDDLLAGISKKATEMGISGNPKIKGYGYVLESELDPGRGAVSTVVVTNGTIKKGESYICGKVTGRIRAMFDEKNKAIDAATPGTPVRIIGLSEPIASGELFQVTENEKESKRIAEMRSEIERQRTAARVKPITLSNLFAAIKESNIKELRLVVKCDTFGSQEAIKSTLETLKNDEIKANIVHSSVGQVNENDVNLAVTTKSEIIAFNVRISGKIKKLAEEKHIKIKQYRVIYEIVEDIKENLTEKLGDKFMEDVKATLLVKDVFKISGAGKVAGCLVEEGTIERSHKARVVRDGKILYTGDISSLKRFKEDAGKVESGNECGLSVKNFQDVRIGDVIEALEVRRVKKKLELKTD